MRSAVALALALGVATTISSAAALQGAARSERAVPFTVGETLTYNVSWSAAPLTAGTAVVSVKEKISSVDSTAYSIVAEGRPTPLLARIYSLFYRMDTLLDGDTLLPRRGTLYAEEGKDRRTSTTQFDRTGNRALFEEQSGTATKTELAYPVPAQTQDGLSTLYALRAMTLKAGDRIATPVADSGSLYNIELNVGTPEPVNVPFGTVSAWPLKGVIKDADGQPVWNNIAIWISTDARRLPLKLQADLPIGAFILALREVPIGTIALAPCTSLSTAIGSSCRGR